MRRFICFASLTLAGVGAPRAAGEFVPGRVYVSGVSTLCDPQVPMGPGDAIFEFDPVTRTSRTFAFLPDEYCLGSSGVTFTPDGSRLRVSNDEAGAIFEVDGDGNVEIALPNVGSSQAGNNIAYDPSGNFYFVDGLHILRFPAAGGPPEVFADFQDGVLGDGPI